MVTGSLGACRSALTVTCTARGLVPKWASSAGVVETDLRCRAGDYGDAGGVVEVWVVWHVLVGEGPRVGGSVGPVDGCCVAVSLEPVSATTHIGRRCGVAHEVVPQVQITVGFGVNLIRRSVGPLAHCAGLQCACHNTPVSLSAIGVVVLVTGLLVGGCGFVYPQAAVIGVKERHPSLIVGPRRRGHTRSCAKLRNPRTVRLPMVSTCDPQAGSHEKLVRPGWPSESNNQNAPDTVSTRSGATGGGSFTQLLIVIQTLTNPIRRAHQMRPPTSLGVHPETIPILTRGALIGVTTQGQPNNAPTPNEHPQESCTIQQPNMVPVRTQLSAQCCIRPAGRSATCRNATHRANPASHDKSPGYH